MDQCQTMVTLATEFDLRKVNRVSDSSVLEKFLQLVRHHNCTIFFCLRCRCTEVRQCYHPLVLDRFTRWKVSDVGFDFTTVQPP